MARVNGLECALCNVKDTCFFSELKDAAFQDFKNSRISNVYKKRQVVFYEGHSPHGVLITKRFPA